MFIDLTFKTILKIFSLIINISIFLLFPIQNCWAQHEVIPELLKKRNEIKHDTDLVDWYFRMSVAHHLSDYKLCIAYGDSCIELANKTNQNKHLINALNNVGAAYQTIGNYNKALEYLFQALRKGEEMGDKLIQAYALDNIGISLQSMKQYEYALEYMLKAFKLELEIEDYYGVGTSCINIGQTYLLLKNYEKAKEYFNKAIEIGETYKHDMIKAYGLNSMAQIYADEYNYFNSLKLNQEALPLLQKVKDRTGIVTTLASIGTNYYELGDYQKSVQYLKQAIAEAELFETKEKLAECYDYLSEAYYKMGNYKEAFVYKKLLSQYKDTLYNIQSFEKMTEMAKKYDTEKKNAEILLLNKNKELQEKELQKQSIIKNSFIIGFVLIFLLSLLIFNQYRIKQSANIKLTKQKNEILMKNEELQQQKEEISSQMEQINEQKYKLEILNQELLQQKEEIITQKDEIEKQRSIAIEQRDLISSQKKNITDSIRYARRIQTAVLQAPDSLSLLFSDSFILNKPKDIVSGDFYWIHRVKGLNSITNNIEEWIYLAVADCTGHGVPGSFMSLLCHNLLDQIVLESPMMQPHQLLNTVSRRLAEKLKLRNEETTINDGMDIAIVAINKKQEKLLFAGVRNSLIIVNDNGINEYKSDFQPLGELNLKNFQGYQLQTFNIKNEDKIYLFTDGFYDQFEISKLKKFSKNRFKELLLSMQTIDMKSQAEVLQNTFEHWKGNTEQIDDVLILGVKI